MYASEMENFPEQDQGATQRFPRSGKITAYQTTVSVWEDKVDERMFAIFAKACTHLHGRGFTVRVSPEAKERYPSLSRTWRIGAKRGLEYQMRLSGRQLELKFFPIGERYAHRMAHRMPPALRLLCLAEMWKAAELFLSLGYTLGDALDREVPLWQAVRFIAEGRSHTDPLKHFNASWDGEYERRRGTHRFERDETGWLTPKEYRSWSHVDRDGKPLAQGVVKYYRAYDGYLRRATFYGGINGSWIACSPGRIDYVQARETFDCEHPELEPRRFKAGQPARLRAEVDKAIKAQNWKRVGEIASVLQRLDSKEVSP